MLRRIIAFLAKRAPLLLALGVCLGLLLPDLAALSRPLLGTSVWLLLFLAALRIDIARSLGHLRRPVPILGTTIWMLLLTPILCWGFVTVFSPGPGLAIALILMAGGAPLMSTPSLAQLLGLDDALAMLVMILSTALVPLTLPVIALTVLGLDLGIDPLAWSLDLGLFIGSAVATAFLARRLLGQSRITAARHGLDLLIVGLLLLFAVAIMDGVALRLLTETGFVLRVAALAFGAYLLLLCVSGLVGRMFGHGLGPTVGFICANRNVGILLAVLPAGSHPDIFLYFAIWQMPMYIMPALLAPFYRRG